MLAEVLERTRERTVDELERRAAASESTDAPWIGGRRRRLNGLLQEVIAALRRGRVDDGVQPLAPFVDPTRELRERELVRRYLIEEIEQGHAGASTGETALVSTWAAEAERRRLREQNERLRSLLDDVEESAALFAPDGRVLYCNARTFERLREALGVRREDVLGKTLAELGVPCELPIGRPMGDLMNLARRRETFQMNVGGRLKEGQFNAVYGTEGNVAAIELLIRDVHAHKLSQTRLALLTKINALVGILEYDELAEALAHVPIPELADWCAVTFIEDRRIRRTVLAHRNPSKASLHGEGVRAVVMDRHPLWQQMMTTGFQLLSEVSDDLLRGLSGTEQHYRLLTQLGPRSLMVVPLVARGKITGIITFAYTDESGRRYGRDDPVLAEELALHAAHTFENARLMKELKLTEARFHIALAGAQTLLYEQDASLRYVWYYNPVMGGDVVGKRDEELFSPEDAAMLTAAKRRVMEEGERLLTEMDVTFGAETRHHYREAIAPLRDTSGRILGIIGAATDITDQQRSQQQLTAELDFRERMMGILGHDLRNPLNVVILAADQLMRDQELPPAAQKRLLRLRRSAARMHEMIETLLDFTRARFMGSVPVSPVPADLGTIARATIDDVRALWPDSAITLELRGDPRGEWDPARMTQTIGNLVTNAISYGERGGRVQVAINAEGRDVELTVHNQGPAIPAEIIPVLFAPFRRGACQDRSPGGLGLGLYIVAEIVKAHGGSIRVDSTDRDGTTFTLRLPRHPATQQVH